MRSTIEDNEPMASRIRHAMIRLALATAVSSTALVIAAEAAHARIVVNHSEAAGRDRRRQDGRRSMAALALVATVAVPASIAVACPASAAGCSPYVCGADGNHNGSAGIDRQ